MLVFQRIDKVAFETECAWCGCPIEVGDRVVYLGAEAVPACCPECAQNLKDDGRDREAARRMKRLPAIGEALLREAA